LRTQELINTVLKLSRGREFYGYDLHKKLTSGVADVEISRFYRVLATMLGEGLLKSRWEKSSFGPRRRVYLLSEKGRRQLDRILLDAIHTIHDFYADYLLDLPPDADVFDSLCKPLTDGLRGEKSVAYVVADYSPMDERILSTLRRRVPQGTIYLAKPRSVDVEPKIENLMVLDATRDNIPLKDNYLDVLMATDIPPSNALETTLREWHRLLRQGGLLGILAPTVTLRKHKDPLTIGDFIEKYEHEITRKSQHSNSELLTRLRRRFFQNLEEIPVAHMTLLVASKRRSPHP
jgi:DNA-binding PadR family transcriptional regulator